jgi:hypothetical protein
MEIWPWILVIQREEVPSALLYIVARSCNFKRDILLSLLDVN